MPEAARTKTRVTPPATDGPDRSGLRLGLFVAGLVFALVGGFGLGKLTGGEKPADGASAAGGMAMPSTDPANHAHAPGTAEHDHGSSGMTATAGADLGGLSLSGSGYTLVPAATDFTAGKKADLRFTVRGPDRQPVKQFAVVHEKQMHLVVARRDLSGYQHLHPTMAADGTWSIPLTLGQPGLWRAFADFTLVDAAGAQIAATLGTDLVVAGDYAPKPLPAPAREATTGEFTVTYEGTPTVGATQPLQFRVFRDGNPVADLEPYLGSYGHLVVLRQGDVGYLHVHPDEQRTPGTVKFWLAAPSPGSYRAFFDFQVAGKVHTAEFTVRVD
ncbi:hypothetical protein Ais01nite_37450 [Asanoa ishikariensis]|uniref:Secreted protein n=1 Tax=Asanoa ishikariensis TaxID=137265 RepID=A0A1H3LVQ9_9ACTN|nr:hypothetical protein [Asanoa ishikariensis]GIF65710.1 hypothetical protein Ais01nite_37450 [Asanoa ishikariensis]SDY68104.1 hypothetical protein SAMN05421684_0983 [Asanoa ishikariensis]